ncbi:MAG: hypothetical protein EOO55_02705 [Hymenobacter sp.]|nr:MAG: hypothetical protein EOO55_02705 [Hymenobacter sp.]
MNSAEATFWVQETAYVVRSLTQHMHQETNDRGLVNAQPANGELRLVLENLPHDVLLSTWAYTPHLALPARVVFEALDGVSQPLTLTLEEAYCVGFEEHFESNGQGQAAHYYIVSVVARRIIKQGVAYVNQWADTTQ